jgi:hypothetical protein
MKDEDTKEVVPVEFKFTFPLVVYRYQLNSFMLVRLCVFKMKYYLVL